MIAITETFSKKISRIKPTEMQSNTRLYRISKDFEFEELRFLREENDQFYLIAGDKSIIKLNKQAFEKLSYSRITVLSELEEILKLKLSNVHNKMREHKIKFVPSNSVNIVYQLYADKTRKELHQYDLVTGKYLESFSSLTEACKKLEVNITGRISQVCSGKFRSAYGYRWSYKKVHQLQSFKKLETIPY